MKKNIKEVSGNIVDVLNSKVYSGTIKISDKRIVDIVKENNENETYIVPGLIDSHIHIESSMLPPSEFSRIAAIHGTVAAISDSHEIANVLGGEGVKYMIEDANAVPMKFYFSAPSCVPATLFETSGAVLDPAEVERLLMLEEIKYLGEVMNFPGVLNNDPVINRKMAIAKKYAKLIDGHAPGLSDKDLEKYVSSGISTDHECFTKNEALEKISLGMKVQIREGSAARNFDELIPIVEDQYESCMFCSDDKHPDELVKGHINGLVKRALNYGIDVIKILKVASINPVLHYGLDVGLLRVGDYADFIEVDNLNDFNILKTFVNGEIVAEEGTSLISRRPSKIINNFNAGKKKVIDFSIQYKNRNINVIEVIDGQLITGKLVTTPKVVNGYAVSDVGRDILKIAVVNRYKDEKVAIGFVKNFGITKGAIASSVAHDSHNIIAVGATDEDICRAVNLIIEKKGGITAVSGEKEIALLLPIAGIMSNQEYSIVAKKYIEIDDMAKSMGSKLHAPFMTLSFMALIVIPKIKLSDKGLFDVEKFEFIDIFE
ncbi:MAG: adenine deaminase [Thermodesulfobacteriota bacterium]|nr:adenine deaminase [Thermodesulfobacteriota bacterium]